MLDPVQHESKPLGYGLTPEICCITMNFDSIDSVQPHGLPYEGTDRLADHPTSLGPGVEPVTQFDAVRADPAMHPDLAQKRTAVALENSVIEHLPGIPLLDGLRDTSRLHRRLGRFFGRPPHPRRKAREIATDHVGNGVGIAGRLATNEKSAGDNPIGRYVEHGQQCVNSAPDLPTNFVALSPARSPLDVPSTGEKATEGHIEWTRGSGKGGVQEADQDLQDSLSMMMTGPSGLLFLY